MGRPLPSFLTARKAALSAAKPGTRTRQTKPSATASTTLSTDTETNAEAEGRTKADAIPKRWNTASILILLIATSNGRTPTELADLSFRSIARRISKKNRKNKTNGLCRLSSDPDKQCASSWDPNDSGKWRGHTNMARVRPTF